MARYAVFIDGGYTKKVLSELGNLKISYLNFSECVANTQERLRTYYYDCAPYVSSPPLADEKKRKADFDRFTFALEREPRFQVKIWKAGKKKMPDMSYIRLSTKNGRHSLGSRFSSDERSASNTKSSFACQ